MKRCPRFPGSAVRLSLFLVALGAILAGAAVCRPSPAPLPVEKPLTFFDDQGDIGKPARPGSATEDPADGSLVIAGAGANMWFAADEAHFVWKKLKGDFIVTARVEFIGRGIEAHRKIGWMARATLGPDAPQAGAVVHGDGLTSLQFRRKAGTDTEEIRLPATAPDQIQLERRGSTYIMSAARFGEPYASEQVTDLDLGEEPYVGLFVCSHNPEVTERARFTNIRITLPAPEGFVPYQDYIGGVLEVLDVESGWRTEVFRSPRPIQAPNWTKDGRFLIYNADGLLFRFEIATGRVSQVDTGSVKANNNDHVLSFDGKRLGISSQSDEDGGESVGYVLPAKGGKPERITRKAPSYLHGWSPDGRFLVFTGGRDGNFDVYRIPSAGGDEVRLTDAPGLDDGPEYTPDGRFIYFNSARTGAMRIWRMAPDGSGQEAVTSGEFHDWFPHVSPDGRRIVFLSFGKDVAADDHPFYKEVCIRMMPTPETAGTSREETAAGSNSKTTPADSPAGTHGNKGAMVAGAPRVIAYVYGGQGTINVPSWSPDSRHLAFVSNTR